MQLSTATVATSRPVDPTQKPAQHNATSTATIAGSRAVDPTSKEQNTMQHSKATVAASHPVDPTHNPGEQNATLYRHSRCFPSGPSQPQHSRTQCNSPPPQLLLSFRSIPTST